MSALPAGPWYPEAYIAHDGFLRVSIASDTHEICEVATGAETAPTREISAVTSAIAGLPDLLRAAKCHLRALGTEHEARARIALMQAVAICESTQAPVVRRRAAA